MIALKRVAELYSKLLTTPDGKELLKDLYRMYGKRPSFDPLNHMKTAYNEGQRSVYLRMMHLSKLNPNEIETEAEKLTDD